MSVLIGLIGVVLGALLASWLARWRTVKEARVRHTLNLIDEFHSREMLRARNVAAKVLTSAENPPLSVEQCMAQGEEVWIAISVVLHYFDKVEVLLETKWIEYELLKRLLGRYVRLWVRYLGPNHLLLDAAIPTDSSKSVSHRDWSGLRLSLDQLNKRFAESNNGPSSNRILSRFLADGAMTRDPGVPPVSGDE